MFDHVSDIYHLYGISKNAPLIEISQSSHPVAVHCLFLSSWQYHFVLCSSCENTQTTSHHPRYFFVDFPILFADSDVFFKIKYKLLLKNYKFHL